MPGVLIVGDVAEARLSASSARLATAGARLAQALGEPLIGAIIGADLTRAADEFAHGLERLYVAEGPQYHPYAAASYMAAAQKLIETASPRVILFAHGAETREWVPRLAARIGTGLVMDAADVAVEDGVLIATKPVNGGGVLAEYVIRSSPSMATVRTSGFEPSEAKVAPERIHVHVPPPAETRVTVLSEESAAQSTGPRLKDAKIVVSGGRGIGGPDNWHFIEEASAALGAAVGCSRPVADSGWVPSSHQVGLSGTSVSPDLYIAVGISGAAQHLAGITSARKVVAINNSSDADIFTRADYGVVGDYREVLPAFVQRVKQLRG
jgi:electron transfer flavoprotein alpha subunit